jgi:hypothetical protein
MCFSKEKVDEWAFQTSRLFTMDLKAINHILMNNQAYQKPKGLRSLLSRLLGNGVLVVEGAKHREQVCASFFLLFP